MSQRSPNWIVLILSTHGEENLPLATKVMEQMHTRLEQLKKTGTLENFYCIYELFPDDPHIDFGLKTGNLIPQTIECEIRAKAKTGNEGQLENDEVLKALGVMGLSGLLSQLKDLEVQGLLKSGQGILLRLRLPDKELIEDMKAIATAAAFMYRNDHSDILKLAYFLHMYSNVSGLIASPSTWMNREIERLTKWDADRLRDNARYYLAEEHEHLPHMMCAVEIAIAKKEQTS